jgi:hypothetical protein
MKLIYDNLPMENVETEGNIEFIMGGYYYNIGDIDGITWIFRMTEHDYENGGKNYERVGNWIPENASIFKFFKGKEK